MKITKTINEDTTTYFYDDVKKYEHLNDNSGFEQWREYDKNGNETRLKTSSGYEQWKKYDENNNEIYLKTSDGFEWRRSDDANKPIEIEEDEVKQFEFK